MDKYPEKDPIEKGKRVTIETNDGRVVSGKFIQQYYRDMQVKTAIQTDAKAGYKGIEVGRLINKIP